MEDKEKKLALQKAVGERVYHSRKLARMSKEELAERLGISSQYVNDIEQGKRYVHGDFCGAGRGVPHRAG